SDPAKPRSGTWQVAQDTVLSPDRIGSEKSRWPRATFSGVSAFSPGAGGRLTRPRGTRWRSVSGASGSAADARTVATRSAKQGRMYNSPKDARSTSCGGSKAFRVHRSSFNQSRHRLHAAFGVADPLSCAYYCYFSSDSRAIAPDRQATLYGLMRFHLVD